MNDFESRWQQLVAAARQAPGPEGAAAPYGFATRVAARAFEEERAGFLTVFGRFSVRALWLAGLLLLASVAASYFDSSSLVASDADQSQFDPVSEVLASASS